MHPDCLRNIACNLLWLITGLLIASSPLYSALKPSPQLTTTPILRLDSGMNVGGTDSFSVDASGRLALTTNSGNTARLWEVPSGRLLRTWRLPIYRSSSSDNATTESYISACALSPDGKLAAIAASVTDLEAIFVYVFETTTGELLKKLDVNQVDVGDYTQNDSQVEDMSFSESGRFLAVSLEIDRLIVWESSTWKLIGINKDDHIQSISELKGAYGPTAAKLGRTIGRLDWHGDERIVATNGLGKLSLYSVQGKLKRLPTKESHGGFFLDARFSPEGNKVCVCFKPSDAVTVLSGTDLTPFETLHYTHADHAEPTAITWCKDGRILIAADFFEGDKDRSLVRVFAKLNQGIPDDIVLPVGSISFLRSLSEGIFFGADSAIGVRIGEKVRLFDRRSIHDWSFTFGSFRLSDDGTIVSFPFDNQATALGYFDLLKGTLRDATPSDLLSLHTPKMKGVNLTHWCSVDNSKERKLALSQGATAADVCWFGDVPQIAGEPRYIWPGDLPNHGRSLAIARDLSFFLLGGDHELYCEDRLGNERWTVGINGDAWAVNVSADGKLAVVACGDGTIRWFDVEHKGRQLLAFLPNTDRKRWIAWTQEGYFDCSPGAEDLVGWHVNRGKNQPADFFPVARFHSTYYRPDVIRRVLKTRNIAAAVRDANEALGKHEGLDAVAKVVQRLSPPVVELHSGGVFGAVDIPADAQSVKVRYAVRNTGQEKATQVTIRLNGRPLVENAPLPAEGQEAEVEVPLPDGLEGEFSLIASHEWASSEAALLRVRRTGGSAKTHRAELYVIAAGVAYIKANDGLERNSTGTISEAEFRSRFPVGSICFDDLPGADTDSARVAAMFAKQKGSLFGEVHPVVLPNEQATTENLRKALRDCAAHVQPGDLVVFSFSGHGYSDQAREFFLSTYDVDPSKPTATALTGRELKELLAPVRGSVVLFLDACQSGAVLGRREEGKVIAGPEDLTGLVNTLGSNELGIVVFSSSSEEEVSFESKKGGYFTIALEEGMGGAAVTDGKVTCAGLQEYVSRRVPELVRQNPELRGYRQTPLMIMPKGVPDFPLAEP